MTPLYCTVLYCSNASQPGAHSLQGRAAPLMQELVTAEGWRWQSRVSTDVDCWCELHVQHGVQCSAVQLD